MHTAALTLVALALLGDFDTPASTNVREKIVGSIVAGTPAITPASGDQIGAFAGTKLVGMFAFTSASPDFSITIYGDIPSTAEVEGAKQNERIRFRFFDDSTNTEQTLQVVNSGGEAVNLTYRGQELPPIDPVTLAVVMGDWR